MSCSCTHPSIACYFFLSNLSEFQSFVGAIDHAAPGEDWPEDVMGGLQKTFSRLSWGKEAAKFKVGWNLVLHLIFY